jgi:preprotein translocase subunit SecE
VARDRKRAKQRRDRSKIGQRTPGGAPSDTRPELHRADLPGALEHASGEVEEFDAALVAGAGGVAVGDVDGGAGNGAVAEEEEVARAVEHREHRRSLPARAVAFLRASWAELQRVQWPDRPQVSQATAVVLGFVAIAGLYLGVADWVAQKIVNLIL